MKSIDILSIKNTFLRLCVLSSVTGLLVVIALSNMLGVLAQESTAGKIAFTSDRSGQNEIWLMNPDSTNQINLTNNSAAESEPSFSPDGSRIAFRSDRDGNLEIYVMNADGTSQTRLTNNTSSDFQPSFSQTGARIAFSSDRAGNFEIYVMNSDGSGQTRLTTNPAIDIQASFSPDGTRIAFVSNRDGNEEIYIMNSDGTNQTRLTNNSASDSFPNFSPDGMLITFTSSRDGNNEIYVMNSDGTNQTRLTNNSPISDFQSSFSPDGARITFARNPGNGNTDIYVMDANGTNQTRLTTNGNIDTDPSWGGTSTVTPTPTPTTFTVNTTSDTNDGACDTTHCSLREAILAANINAGAKDTIAFNIPGSGPHTITPTSALPTITDPVIIDGYTQPGAMPNTNATGAINAVLKIELNGSSAGTDVAGLTISAGNSTVRGLVINRFSVSGFAPGVRLETNDGNFIEGNFIGTNVTGTAALGNSFGVGVFDTSSNNTIGGTTAAARNVISGNLYYGISVNDFTADTSIIQGNLIGTDATGTIALGQFTGIQITAAPNNTIGGTTAAARNVISGNSNEGISLSGDNTLIQGNYIGTDAGGTANLGNGGQGISVSPVTNSTIRGNIIAFNGAAGVSVSSDSTGISILSNSIFSNTGLGIDLASVGVTPNDPADPDTGANNRQNYPVLTSAMTGSGAGNVQGTLNSTPSTTFRVEFFSNAACDSSGFGEGQTFIGFQSVMTDSSGNSTINFTPSSAIAANQFITATATDPDGNTSEFSACRQALATTAASVSVGGRVMTAFGRGVGNVVITMTDSNGNLRAVRSNNFGYYRFDEVITGETYVFSVRGKRYYFTPQTQVHSVNDEMSKINFIVYLERK